MVVYAMREESGTRTGAKRLLTLYGRLSPRVSGAARCFVRLAVGPIPARCECEFVSHL